MPFFCVSGPILGALAGPGERSCFFSGSFFCFLCYRRAPAERTFGSLSGGRGFFFLLSGVECLRVERAGGRSSARTRVVRFFSCCQEGAWPGGWQDGRGFFFGRGSLFFPCPPGGGLGGEPQARSSSFAFVSRFLRRSRRPPPSKRRREAEFNSAKARFFPFVFPFFSARLAGPGAR